MASQGLLKMSLLAQYDDLCRNTKVLTSGSEEEFKLFVENQLNCVRKWKKVDAENKKLHSKITNLESENGRLETKIKHLKNLLEEADSTRRKVEFEKKCLERTIAAVKDVILSGGVVDDQTKEKLAFLNTSYKTTFPSPAHLQTIEESHSLFSLSDVDQTDDDLENCRRSSNHRSRRSNGKRSSSETRTSLKKKKLSEAEEFLNKINKESDQQSSSEATSTSPDAPIISQQINKLDPAQLRFNAYDQKYDTDSTVGSTPVSRQSSLKRFSKKHQFVSKTVFKATKCKACKQNIAYLKQSLKCQSCGVTYHPECKNVNDMYCFPIINTPTKGTTGKVADYTSTSSPMIPPLIFHCVREIESRGLNEIGLYRVSASERDVKGLIHKFVSGSIIPSVNDVDIHTLCVAVKEFLRTLSEPLITRKSWRDFVEAAKLKDLVEREYALYGLVNGLPQPNRDTLAFLILHWKRIAESTQCKMDIENLSRILGPTVVGYSNPDLERIEMYQETIYQQQVMKGLLTISTESWQSIMSVEMTPDVEGTPENIPPPKGKLLGPVYASVQKRKSLTLRKTPLTPRNSKSKPGRMYFASPLLK